MLIEQPSLKKWKLTKSLLVNSKDNIKEVKYILRKHFKKEVILVNSARTGIYLCLKAKGIKRTDEIVVPPYTSQCVLNAINHTAFPNTKITDKTKAILLLHQFGYPQKVDRMNLKKYFVIEDCAHSISSTYCGTRVGDFFDTSVVSFPKIFSTIQGGCIITKDKEIIDYCNNVLQQDYFGELLQSLVFSKILYNGQKNNFKNRKLIEAVYSQFVNIPNIPKYVCKLFPSSEEIKFYLRKRENILQRFETQIGKRYFPKTKGRIVPYCIPYLDCVENLEKIQKRLQTKGINLPILHFDVNMNMLKPNYKKCLIIPAHQTIKNEVFNKIITSLENK